MEFLSFVTISVLSFEFYKIVSFWVLSQFVFGAFFSPSENFLMQTVFSDKSFGQTSLKENIVCCFKSKFCCENIFVFNLFFLLLYIFFV